MSINFIILSASLESRETTFPPATFPLVKLVTDEQTRKNSPDCFSYRFRRGRAEKKIMEVPEQESGKKGDVEKEIKNGAADSEQQPHFSGVTGSRSRRPVSILRLDITGKPKRTAADLNLLWQVRDTYLYLLSLLCIIIQVYKTLGKIVVNNILKM